MAYADMIDPGGTGGYDFSGAGTTQKDLLETLAGIPTGHVKKKKWYRKYRRWSDFWRESTKGALGYGGYDASDPLAKLQEELLGAYNPEAAGNAYENNVDFSGLLGARNRGLRSALQQQGARLGAGDAFQGVLDEASLTRSALAGKTLAAYQPQAFQQQQQLSDQTGQLLAAISQADFAAQSALEGAGRQA